MLYSKCYYFEKNSLVRGTQQNNFLSPSISNPALTELLYKVSVTFIFLIGIKFKARVITPTNLNEVWLEIDLLPQTANLHFSFQIFN